MKQITFIGTTSTNYIFGKGRGKDKKKRKRRNFLTDGKDFVIGTKNFIKEANIKKPQDVVDIYNKRKDASSVGTTSTILLGAGLGARHAIKMKQNPKLGALIGVTNMMGIGGAIDKRISKEKARYRKEGARTRLGKVANDARIGAASTAGTYALDGAFRQVMRPGSIKTKVIKGIAGTIYGGAKGALIGGTVGSGVGLVRGFVQPNKKKEKVIKT